ncbi:MAG TPA: CBS domain-containing protein [Chromatiales bacterium]|nr:CBS domain-containing protein [Thiotrichales bacterium]HIP67669.1 CBS domain-containing protein [Chromatiales bacterium]
MSKYKSVPFKSLPVGATYSRPVTKWPEGLTADSPAIDVMTDLRKVTALTVERTTTLSATRERMKKLGVRMQLVTGATAAVMGVITLTDLDSGRAEKIASKTGEDAAFLQVQHVMTLTGRIEVMTLESVKNAKIGDILTSFNETERRHALVLNSNTESGQDEICGIFSLTVICKLIGLDVAPGDPMEKVKTQLASILK